MLGETSRQHAGLGDQHGRAPLRIDCSEPAVRTLNLGSASILLALAGMLLASHLALAVREQPHAYAVSVMSSEVETSRDVTEGHAAGFLDSARNDYL